MKTSLVQMDCDLGNVEANMKKVLFYSSQARTEGSDLVVFPEMIDTGYNMDVIRQKASSWDKANKNNPFNLIKKAGKDNKLHIICNISEKEEDEIYNTTLVVNPEGEVIGKYRKNHLADYPPLNEGSCFTPGKEFAIIEINKIKLGLLTCYDLRFPEISRALVLKGVDALVLCSAWPFPRLIHWNTLVRARAIENQVFFVAVNRVGNDGTATFCGSSRVVDPYGVILSSASESSESFISCEIDLETIKKVRKNMPIFNHRTNIDKQPLL
jgi:predicted amidohydrolase